MSLPGWVQAEHPNWPLFGLLFSRRVHLREEEAVVVARTMERLAPQVPGSIEARHADIVGRALASDLLPPDAFISLLRAWHEAISLHGNRANIHRQVLGGRGSERMLAPDLILSANLLSGERVSNRSMARWNREVITWLLQSRHVTSRRLSRLLDILLTHEAASLRSLGRIAAHPNTSTRDRTRAADAIAKTGYLGFERESLLATVRYGSLRLDDLRVSLLAGASMNLDGDERLSCAMDLLRQPNMTVRVVGQLDGLWSRFFENDGGIAGMLRIASEHEDHLGKGSGWVEQIATELALSSDPNIRAEARESGLCSDESLVVSAML